MFELKSSQQNNSNFIDTAEHFNNPRKTMKSITRHNVNTDKCVENIGSRFDLVLVAALRVRELKRGHRSLLNTATKNGTTITALAEIEAGLVGRDYLRKI